MRRSVSVFGSTGSIGRNTVDLLQRQGGREAYEVAVLTGAGNIALLARQARALGARLAVTADRARLDDLKDALSGSGVEAAAGPAALEKAAAEPVHWAMSAIVGAAGLKPTLAIARNGGVLALANKESLVCAGGLLKSTCAAHGTRLVPVDSEHSAIHQALNGERRAEVERIILTASGGPFLDRSLAEMADVTLAQAVAHPNWSMGQRISIDSATMFNKALEVIEAAHLFDATSDMIEVVVHPQSIIHSMVGFRDGAIMAQLGPPDMRGAIGYALNWPSRTALPLARLDFPALSRLDFIAADPVRFPALRLAREVLAAGGLSGVVLNGAKEAAQDAFIGGQIGFLDMAVLVEHVLDHLSASLPPAAGESDIDMILALDARSRACCRSLIDNRRSAARARPAPATATAEN